MSDIDKDINRCKELIKTEHSNWIGMSNQDAIENVLSDREFLQDKVNWYSKEYDKLFDENNKLRKELETYKRIANMNLKDSEEFNKNMCEHRCPLKTDMEESIETYKKIAELFGKSLINIFGEKTSLEELIDWAKREVENENRN